MRLDEVRLRAGGEVARLDIVVVCDVYGRAMPSSFARALVTCTHGLPDPCAFDPPPELDFLIDEALGALIVRWEREIRGETRALDRWLSATLAAIDMQAEAQLAMCARHAADLRRRRRMWNVTPDQARLLGEAAEEIEDYAARIAAHARARRAEVRHEYDARADHNAGRNGMRVELEPPLIAHWRVSAEVGQERTLSASG